MWLYVVYSLQPQAKVDSKKGDFLILALMNFANNEPSLKRMGFAIEFQVEFLRH